jgi:hypothetical protein
MRKGEIRFTLLGEPRRTPGEGAVVDHAAPPVHIARKVKEPGRSEGFLTRLGYKFLESIFACVMFSVVLRVVIFIVRVVDSLMETGGDVKEGISFAEDIQRAVSWYEVAAWVLVAVLVFRLRHPPR